MELNASEFYQLQSSRGGNYHHYFAVTFSTRQKDGLVMRQESVRGGHVLRIEILIEDGHLFYM